ncbi:MULTISPECIES: RNHCP domain-containing protein [unclassified Frankia]|uniref:RNHCP domain-containing protein n=1 Tax=unclassified Frankia TaxID=2632575 RepID=UPI001EF4197A|nr:MULTISPECIES: RNHCP domain-containing protein [unclassified Frankia]
MPRRFVRTTEDFECLVCGTPVRGNGYTNHCPCCLWSRHVDVNPGDRAAECRGAMRPVAVETGPHDIVLTHRCETCGHQRRNRTSPADDIDMIIEVSAAGWDGAGIPIPPGAREEVDGGVRGSAVRGRDRGSGARRRPGRPR